MIVNSSELASFSDSDIQQGFRYRKIISDFNPDKHSMQLNTLTHNAIFFQISGELSISWNGNNDVIIHPGELYFLPRGANVTAHMISDEIEYVAARFDHNIDNKSIFKRLLNESGDDSSYTFQPLPIREPLDLFIKSMKYYIENRLNRQLLQNVKFIELYAIFSSCYTREECANLFRPILRSHSKFRMFILDNYQVTVTIGELLKKSNMSRSTFDRAFKENFGTTPHRWIDAQTEMLMRRKASEPNVTVKDMMYEVGVYNSSQFTKLCKRLCGVTPSQLIRP